MNEMQSLQMAQAPQTAILAPQTVLVHTAYCTVREQEQQHLIYNTKTDEMYLIPKTGAYIYELCDGLSTVEELEAAFARAFNDDGPELKAQLNGFLHMLVERGILRAEHDV